MIEFIPLERLLSSPGLDPTVSVSSLLEHVKINADSGNSPKVAHGVQHTALKPEFPLCKIPTGNHYLAATLKVDNTKDSTIGSIDAFVKFEVQDKVFWVGFTPSCVFAYPFRGVHAYEVVLKGPISSRVDTAHKVAEATGRVMGKLIGVLNGIAYIQMERWCVYCHGILPLLRPITDSRKGSFRPLSLGLASTGRSRSRRCGRPSRFAWERSRR